MLQDLRYILRTLRKSPGFAAVAILCLALGIGANTAIFSLVDAALMRMLPVADPNRLVAVQSVKPEGRSGSSFSYPQFAYLRAHAWAVAGMFAYARIDLNLSAGSLTDAPKGLAVSSNYFSVLGVQPAIGRGFAPSDEGVAVLGYRYWQTRFQGDPGIAGRAIVMNGVPVTVIGVAPRSFFGVEVGSSPDVYVPLENYDRLYPGAPRLPRPNNFWLAVMARLRPDIGMAQAAAQTDVVYHQGMSEQAPTMRPNVARMLQQWRIAFAPGSKGMGGFGAQFGTPLLIVMAVVSLVLLIACANVANLLLARAAARRREVAVRLALGAGRGRLLRQFFTESLVLASAGGALGLLFAVWGARALTGFLANRVLDVTPDGRMLAFTIAASAITGLLFGAAPAMRASRPDLTPALKGESSLAVPGRARFARFLVSGQVAVSLLVLIGAGLFIRTLANLRNLDAGFHGEHVLLAELNPGLSRYTPERANAFYADVVSRVSATPGVQSVSLASYPLLGGAYIDGFSIQGSAENIETSVCIVGPRFFETMGIAIRLGRDFLAGDRADAPKVAIINETIARKYFAGENPVGRRLGGGVTIVGVIADTKYRGLRDAIPNTIYYPMEQGKLGADDRTLHVRTLAAPAGMVAGVREQVRALDKNLPVRVRLFSDLVDENLAQERLVATLSGSFGGLALVLAAIGLYGVIAYSVQARTREIGIRMSLGAGRAAVLWMVLRDCLLLVGIGIAVGVPVSLWLSKLVTRQLFGLAPGDPGTVVAAAAVMVVVAGVAGYLPARRASRVDPMVALRYE